MTLKQYLISQQLPGTAFKEMLQALELIADTDQQNELVRRLKEQVGDFYGSDIFNGKRIAKFTQDFNAILMGMLRFADMEVTGIIKSYPEYEKVYDELHARYNTSGGVLNDADIDNDPDGYVRRWMKNHGLTKASFMVYCPRCKKLKRDPKLHRNSLSRRDNQTYICNDCGQEEALVDAKLADEEALQRDAQFRHLLKKALARE